MEEALTNISGDRLQMRQHFDCTPPASRDWPEQWQQYPRPRELLLGAWLEEEGLQASCISDHSQKNLAEE